MDGGAVAGRSDDDDDDDLGIDPTGAGNSGTGQRREAGVIDPDEDDDPDTDTGDDDPDDDEGDKTSGDKGKAKASTTPGEDDRVAKEKKLRRDREATIRDLKAQLKAAQAAGASDDQKAQADLEAKVEGRYKPVAVRASARAAFMEAGLKDLTKPRMDDLMRMVDLDDIEVDDDGVVLGLDEQVDAIKDRWPSLFAAPASSDTDDDPPTRKRAPAVKVADQSKRQPQEKKTMGQRIAAKHGF